MLKLVRVCLRHHRQLLVLAALLLATGLCAAMLILRVAYTRSLDHWTLAWNLGLAWLPMGLALAAYNVFKRDSWLAWLGVAACAAIWLLFFPNAPYMVTDLIHLWRGEGVPYWYDLILLVAFAWTSLLLGLISLLVMQALVRRAAGPAASWLFAFGVLGLSGFGVYLGRFQRWNSWDLFFNPRSLLLEIWNLVRHPLANREALVFSVLFSVFVVSTYLILVAVANWQPALRERRP